MVPMFHDVPIDCINQAVENYAVPASLIMAIIFVEGGKNGLASSNRNGTYDYGVMQINSVWLPQIYSQFGYDRYDLQYDPCKNVDAGTWILKQNLLNNYKQPLMRIIGDYHSHTPNLNYIYSVQVLSAYQTIQKMFGKPSNPCNASGQICSNAD